MNRRRIFFIVGGVALLVLVLTIYYAWQAHAARNTYSGTIETREIQIGSKVGGRVLEVPFEEGAQVKAGALLVRFECDDLKAQHAQALAAVEQAKANYERMLRGNRPEEIAQAEQNAANLLAAYQEAKAGPRKQEIAQAQADYDAALADARDAEVTFERMEKLIASDTISRQQFDDARDKRDASNQKAESARQHLALLQAGTRKEDIDSAEARYKQAEAAAVLSRKGSRAEDIESMHAQLLNAQARVAQLEVSLGECELHAAADGILETVSVRPGDLVAADRIVATMLEPTQLWVKVYIPETDLSRVHLNQQASVKVDGLGRRFVGRVGMISSEAEFLPRNVQTPDDRQHQVFGVRVYVNNSDGTLKSGMSATVHLQ